MGPLGMSAKQHREYLKFQSQEQRENSKMERDEARKNQLHEIKLQEAALKANQGIGHKEDLHEVKLQELKSPLGKPPKMNREKMGLPSINPMSGTGIFKQGQHHLAQGTDTVPAMLTPGEAVIPAPAAQDPKNKKAIKRMVQEGRDANRKKLRDGTVALVKTDASNPRPTAGSYGGVPQQVQQAAGYADGTDGVPRTHDNYPSVYDPETGGYMTEYSITVTDPRLNKGRPTNIPSLWQMQVRDEDQAVANALAHGGPYPSYKSIDQAVKAAESKSKRGGAQAHYADGTPLVPSLAYEHSDVPGSSFSDGTPMVNEYSVGVFGEGVGSEDDLNKYFGQPIRQDLSQQMEVPPVQNDYAVVPSEGVQVASTDDYYNSLGEQYGVPQVVQDIPQTTTPRKEQLPTVSEFYDDSETVGKPNAIPQVVPQPTVVAVPKPADTSASNKPVVPAGTSQATKVVVPPITNSTGLTPQQIEAAVVDQSVPEMPDETAAETARLQRQNDLPTVAAGDVSNAAKVMKSQSELVAEYMAQQGYPASGPIKDEKGFIDSFKNIFTYSGLKDALGFNNQEIARFAVATLAGRARGYNMGHSMAWAGKNAYIESSKRQAQEDADKKAAMRNAITMANQDMRNQQVDKRAAAKEEHDRFIATQQEKIAEIKAQYQRDRDDQKFERQMQVLASQQAAADRRMQATFGNQWNMLYARDELTRNSPQAVLERRQKNVDHASGAAESIMNRDLGSADIKGQPNPARQGLPTSKQIGQQSLSFLKNAGIDVDNTDVYQEAGAMVNQATEEMIRDKKNGTIKSTASIAPYLARNVVTHRMGASKEDFMVGDKEMAPAKIADVYGNISRKVKEANGGIADDRKVSELVSAVRAEWQGPNGKKLRAQFTGNDNETAFYQYLNSKFK